MELKLPGVVLPTIVIWTINALHYILRTAVVLAAIGLAAGLHTDHKPLMGWSLTAAVLGYLGSRVHDQLVTLLTCEDVPEPAINA